MSPNDAFLVLNWIALAAWVLLALLPGKRVVTDLVAGKVVPALLAVVYVAIVAANWMGSEGSFSSLSGVSTLFANPWLLVAGWTHYLAFDLFVGSWEVRDARERGIPHLLVVPCLVLTLMFGPAGWLLYLAVRSARERFAK
jgi:hypothetical protein